MNALENIEAICLTGNEYLFNLKYCLHINKVPYTSTGVLAHPNRPEEFVSIEDIFNSKLDLTKYNGLGISCYANNLIAIDIDHCFSEKLKFDSIDERGKQIYDLFEPYGYIEFSFSGTGMRILLPNIDLPENYKDIYYIKNSNNQVEFYNKDSVRYVTLTGNYISNRVPMETANDELIKTIYHFLDTFMRRPITNSNLVQKAEIIDNRSVDDLMIEVRHLLFNDMGFQNNWYTHAPGSNSNESERDYYLIWKLINNITSDRDKVRELIERSPFYKSKDKKHLNKWTASNYRYFNWQFDHALKVSVEPDEQDTNI